MNEEVIEISLEDIWLLIKRNWIMITACTVVAAMLGLLYTQFLVAPTYTATSKLYIMNTVATRYTEDGRPVINTGDLSLNEMLSKDYMEILKSKRVTNAAAKRMGLFSLGGYNISVSSKEDTRMIQIVVTGTDQKGVARLNNILTEEFIACIHDIVKVDNITVVDPATVPVAPSGPDKTKNMMMAGMVGLVIALAIVFLRYFLDTTIKTPEDVQRHLDLPVLARIPEFSEQK